MKLKKMHAKEGTGIQYMSAELLFLGQSGQPYRGSVYINFTSKGETFDLQMFKQYITSLRSRTLNAENIAYEIYETIEKSIETFELGVIVTLTARGGIQQTLTYGSNFSIHPKSNIFQI